MNYLYLVLCSFVIAIVFCSIIYPLILIWQKRIIKDFVCSLKDEYLIDSSIQEKKEKLLILFVISFMISFSFFDGIRQIGFVNEYSVVLYLCFALSLLLIAYFYFQLVIVTDKRIIVKVLFNSIFMKNKEIIIDEIESLLMSKVPRTTIVMKDKTVHRVCLPKTNGKVIELLQDKLE